MKPWGGGVDAGIEDLTPRLSVNEAIHSWLCSCGVDKNGRRDDSVKSRLMLNYYLSSHFCLVYRLVFSILSTYQRRKIQSISILGQWSNHFVYYVCLTYFREHQGLKLNFQFSLLICKFIIKKGMTR